MLVEGESGMGKSALPLALQRGVIDGGGYLATTCFDAAERRPDACVARLGDSLADHLLCEGQESCERWQSLLREHLGPIARALVELAPSLSHLLPDTPRFEKLGAEESRRRLAVARCRFLEVIARPKHPLALFLDDFQWADAGSLYLLERMFDDQRSAMLVIVSLPHTPEPGAAAEARWTRCVLRASRARGRSRNTCSGRFQRRSSARTCSRSRTISTARSSCSSPRRSPSRSR
jgi:predicted ATPase